MVMAYLEKEYFSLNEEYKNCRVKICHSSKSNYRRLGLLNKYGIIAQISGTQFGVEIDGIKNPVGKTGLFWFTKGELKILEDERGDSGMKNYNYVAIVNLLDDYNKKDYYFAFYEEGWDMTQGDLVVTNARGKDNRILGRIKEIIPAENCDKNITAQVVAVVNEANYNKRLAEEARLKEVAKKKAAIEKELEEEIAKRKTLEFYEKMAEEYKDNPRLAELVSELKELGA